MAQRFYFPREQALTNLGAVGSGWKLYTYEDGTTTLKTTYSDTALSVANANPMTADSNGRFGDIFVGNLADYKAVLKDANDNIIWTADPVDPKTFTLADFDPAPVSFWGTTAGTSIAYTLAADPTQTAYSANSVFYAKFNVACGASPTFKVDDLAILNLKKRDGAGTKIALEANDVLANYKYAIENDGTDVIVLNPEKPYFDARNLTQATETEKGVLEIATKAEQEAGSSDALIVTPLKQKNHSSACKAWVLFTSVTTTSILNSYNVASLTDNGTGDTTVNFTTSFSSALYGFGFGGGSGNARLPFLYNGTFNTQDSSTGQAAGSFRMVYSDVSANFVDNTRQSVIFFGNQ